jgi:hypothetical protein
MTTNQKTDWTPPPAFLELPPIGSLPEYDDTENFERRCGYMLGVGLEPTPLTYGDIIFNVLLHAGISEDEIGTREELKAAFDAAEAVSTAKPCDHVIGMSIITEQRGLILQSDRARFLLEAKAEIDDEKMADDEVLRECASVFLYCPLCGEKLVGQS